MSPVFSFWLPVAGTVAFIATGLLAASLLLRHQGGAASPGGGAFPFFVLVHLLALSVCGGLIGRSGLPADWSAVETTLWIGAGILILVVGRFPFSRRGGAEGDG